MTSLPSGAVTPPAAPSHRRIFWVVFAAAFLGVLVGFLVLVLTLSLLAFYFPNTVGVTPPNAAPHQLTETRVKAVVDTLNVYRTHMTTYPTSVAGGLDLLLAPPSDPNAAATWAGPYLRSSDLYDAWGQPLHYACPGTHNRDGFDLWSDGPTPDPKDDIRNW